MNAPSAYLIQGRIFWREVPNLINDGEKRRPLVVISSPADIAAKSSVMCVACSHSTAMLDALPPHCVLVPPKIGKRATKPPRPTAAICSWIVEVEKSAIGRQDVAGSTGEHVLLQILDSPRRFVTEFLERQRSSENH